MIATGVNATRPREVLGLDVASAEDGTGWLAFWRGLIGPRPVMPPETSYWHSPPTTARSGARSCLSPTAAVSLCVSTRRWLLEFGGE